MSNQTIDELRLLASEMLKSDRIVDKARGAEVKRLTEVLSIELDHLRRHAYVWATDEAAFTGQQVLDLLNQNEDLRRVAKGMADELQHSIDTGMWSRNEKQVVAEYRKVIPNGSTST